MSRYTTKQTLHEIRDGVIQNLDTASSEWEVVGVLNSDKVIFGKVSNCIILWKRKTLL